jgi:hypothetical protein
MEYLLRIAFDARWPAFLAYSPHRGNAEIPPAGIQPPLGFAGPEFAVNAFAVNALEILS